MSIPQNLTFGGVTISPVYSGDPATTRRRGTDGTGNTHQLDIIQSVPKNGRWRHVIRYTVTAVKQLDGSRPSVTATLTMDAPEYPVQHTGDQAAANIYGFMTDLFDEVAAGQS